MSEHIYGGVELYNIPEFMLEKREEIVRCGNCRYYDFDGEPSEVYPDCHWCDKLTVYMPPLGFCSFGKGE